MATTAPPNLAANCVVPFALEDGTTGIITPEARRTYDHIIRLRVGDFHPSGLTDDQAKLILQGSQLSDADLGNIWQSTEKLVAPSFSDGSWTQLEIYYMLHCCQASERLSLNQMAIHYAGSPPSETTSKIRRRSSYAEAGLVFRPSADHDPMPIIPVSPSIPFQHPTSYGMVPAGAGVPPFGAPTSNQATSSQDDDSISQPGLEPIQSSHAGIFRHLGGSESLRYSASQRTDTTAGAERLANLIESRCPKVQIESEIERVQAAPSKSGVGDQSTARDILLHIRRKNPKFKDPSKSTRMLLKTKKAKQKVADSTMWDFHPHEKSVALREAIESHDVGVAQALIEMGTDVKYFHKMKPQLIGWIDEVVPINYTKIATYNNSAEMVSLFLAHGVSTNDLVEALEQAVGQNLPNIVLLLLQHGVDPNSHNGSIFESAIFSQNAALVKLLLRSRTKIRKEMLTRNLPVAVEQKQIEVASLLVLYGADTKFENSLALRKAVQAQRIDLVLAIMKGIDGVARSEIASSVFVEVFQPSSSLSLPEQRLLIEVLLCAGANGDSVAQVLLPVVRAHRRNIIELLVKHDVDLNYNNGEGLRHAVATNNLDILSRLLVGSVSKNLASSLVDEISPTSDNDQMFRILLLLLEKGAKGPPIDQALLRAVQRRNTALVGLLLDHHAKVDVEDSQPLRMAVTNGDLATLDLLLAKGKPLPESMQLLLPLVPQSSPQLRSRLTKSILNPTKPGDIPIRVLNDALLRALSHPLHEVDEYLVPLVDVFIQAGANVDFQRGECFRRAAELESMKLFELLIRHMMEPSSLLPALPVFMKMSDHNQRWIFISIMLEHSARGPQIDQAFVDAIEESVQDEKLINSLLQKADVEYHNGDALVAAMQVPSAKLLTTILDSGRSTRKSRARAAQVLFETGIRERIFKGTLLVRAGIGKAATDNALIQEIRGERNADVVKMLLEHGASCISNDGISLALAISHQDTNILKLLVAKCHDRRFLAHMISKASDIKDANVRYTCLDTLIRGGAAGERLSHALVEELEKSDRRDHRIIQLLVARGAVIDYSNGRAIKFVVASLPNVQILKILVQGTAAKAILEALIPLAMAHRQQTRLPLLQILLDRGASGDQVDAALVAAVAEGPTAQPTIELLLRYNASVNYDRAAAIKIAAQAQSSPILELLLSKDPKPEYFEEALSLAMRSPSSLSQTKTLGRLDTVRLLTRPKNVGHGAVNSSLTQAVQEGDHSLVEHLINSGADPNFQTGSSFVAATQKLDLQSLRLLVRASFELTPKTCTYAFSVMPQGRDRWQKDPELVKAFDSILIPGGAAGLAVDQTFLSAMRSSHAFANDFVTLILRCGTKLNVDFESGRSLCIAVRRARFESVEFLLARNPKSETLQAAFMAIFESGADEETLIRLTQMFIGHSGDEKDIYFQREESATDILYQTLHRHSDKPKLLQALFDSGCRTTSIFSWTFDEQLGSENASELLWLLCQEDSKLDSRTIEILLRHNADPNFRTSVSGNTPLIRAAYLKQPDILLQLLEADAQPDIQDNMGGTVLQHAVMAGNLTGIEHLLAHDAEIDDESLHVAARTLKLPVIKLLLEHGASTALRGTARCEGRTPLAELCRNADLRENPLQLRKAIKCLSAATKDLKVRSADGKSVLFQALDNDCALKMTTALLTSCPIFEDELNLDYNIYSRSSRRYSPIAYVRHFKCVEPAGYRSLDLSQQCCNRDSCPAPELERLLRSYRCKDRFWDDRAGVDQPQGFCNPPQAIAAAITEAEARRQEQERLARANAEKRARKERAAAEKRAHEEQLERDRDAAAEAEQRRADAAAAAERQRTRERVEEEARAIERRAAAERRAIEARTEAELQERELLAEADAREEQARNRREQERYDDETARERERDSRQMQMLREKRNIQVDQRRRESNIQKELMKQEKSLIGERKRLIDSGTKMFKQAAYSGVSRGTMGRVIGEIEDA